MPPQVSTTDQYITCSTSKISVESVRWPHTRFTAPERPALPLLNLLRGSNCMDSGTCTTIDAAVWVTPLCGGSAPPGVCFSVFTGAACYPYCLAVRQTASYNSALRLYNAPNWLDRVHLFNRDCAVHLNPIEASTTPQVSSFVMPQGLDERLQSVIDALNYGGAVAALAASHVLSEYTSLQVESTLANDWVRAAMVQPITGGVSVSCVSHEFARSSVPKQVWEGTGDYGESSFRSTLGPAQPFVFAGDTILTAECEPLSNNFTAIACRVLVHRIYGGDMSQMTLVSLYSPTSCLHVLDGLCNQLGPSGWVASKHCKNPGRGYPLLRGVAVQPHVVKAHPGTNRPGVLVPCYEDHNRMQYGTVGHHLGHWHLCSHDRIFVTISSRPSPRNKYIIAGLPY